MKRILSALLLAFLAVSLHADTVIPPITTANQAGTSLPVLSAYTSLGCVTTGAATNSVNLTATGGIFFDITGTSQLLVQWQTGTGPWRNSLNVQGNGFLDKQGDLVRFVGNGNTTTAWACVSYRTAQAPSTVTGTFSGTISGAVSVTNTVNVLGSVSVTAYPAYTASGITQYTALSSTATDINLTNTAGAAVPCIICLSSNGGAAAGFKFFFGANGASTTNLIAGQGHYIAASTTAQCWGPFVSGTHFYAVGVAASSSLLADVQKAQ
jgi:hypothetical protein